MAGTAMAWSGNCRDCSVIVVVAPYDGDTEQIVEAGQEEWDSFTDCYVCGGSIEWNGSDPARKFGLD